ncbi:hypothetical protein H9P43_003826 [Blastocladiella emersonii ATCC 22665]|nr:hypothetical protein H9P43_003826 [Blastocladiella emersonii ATCC 22665]
MRRSSTLLLVVLAVAALAGTTATATPARGREDVVAAVREWFPTGADADYLDLDLDGDDDPRFALTDPLPHPPPPKHPPPPRDPRRPVPEEPGDPLPPPRHPKHPPTVPRPRPPHVPPKDPSTEPPHVPKEPSGPRPPVRPPSDAPIGDVPPARDLRPHYNRLAAADTRILYIPPFVFLAVWSLMYAVMWAGAIYKSSRRTLILAHPESLGHGGSRVAPASRESEIRRGGGGYAPAAPLEPGSDIETSPAAAAGMHSGDLRDRPTAEAVVQGLVQETRGVRTVQRIPGAGATAEDMERQPLLESMADPTMAGTSTRAGYRGIGGTGETGAHVGWGDTVLGAGTDADPLAGWEFDTDLDWGYGDEEDAATSSARARRSGGVIRSVLLQADPVTAVKNGSQVAFLMFLISLSLAIMGTFAMTALPSPTHHDDVVGSRSRTLTVMVTAWGMTGVGLVWTLAEAMLMSVHDLARIRIVATAALLVMLLVHGAALNGENKARLREVEWRNGGGGWNETAPITKPPPMLLAVSSSLAAVPVDEWVVVPDRDAWTVLAEYAADGDE